MTTALYSRAQRSIQQLREDIGRLESGDDVSAGLQGKVTTALASLTRQIKEVEEYAQREIIAEKRVKAKEQLGRIQADARELKLAFEAFKQSREEQDRQALLAQNPYLPAAGPVNLYAPNAPLGFGSDAHHREMQTMSKQDQTLHYVNSQLNDFIHQGSAFIGSMREQRSIMKSARTKMLNTATTLGVSHETIRWAERRLAEDKWIFWAGVIIVCIVMYYCWSFL